MRDLTNYRLWSHERARSGRGCSQEFANLELRDHAGFGVVRDGEVVHETLGEVLAVVLLEHVFVVEVLEDSHLHIRTDQIRSEQRRPE